MKPSPSSVLTIRVPRSLDRRLAAEARRQRKTRSDAARTILEEALASRAEHDPIEEARRQSVLACARDSDTEALDFIESAADRRGWR